VTPIPVLLSTASVYPERTAAAFEMAAAAGYDGVEVMVWQDPVSQDSDALLELAHKYGTPILAVHAPCLIWTQRVWSWDPVVRLDRAAQTAAKVGADKVVVHPPFRWQREYGRNFAGQVHRLEDAHGVQVAVENMFPIRAGKRQWCSYYGHWDPSVLGGFRNYTLDISHAAVAKADIFDILDRMGEALSHLHLGDGTGHPRDEHLVPGRGNQPCSEVLQALVERGFAGSVALEISTRSVRGQQQREADVVESLQFARTHLAAAATSPSPASP
jgi:sugar phosphate isomerase/epimerase